MQAAAHSGYNETVYEQWPLPSQEQRSNCVIGYVGTETTFRSTVPKDAPMRSVGIMLTPVYYGQVLKQKYPQDYRQLMGRLSDIHGPIELPELAFLLRRLRVSRPVGIAAKLYYESAVVQALSLLMNSPPFKGPALADADIAGLQAVITHLDRHYRDDAAKLEDLARLACMSATKLKYAFKRRHRCTVSEYISRKRMEEAAELLLNSNLDIARIAAQVGYKKAGSFSAASFSGSRAAVASSIMFIEKHYR